jgi:hypothetical protein
VTFDKKFFDQIAFGANIGHEGTHAADGSDWVKSGFAQRSNPMLYQAELDAFTVQSVLGETYGPLAYVSLPYFKEPGKNPYLPEKVRLWDTGWAEANRATLRSANIDRILSRPEKAGGYGVTPTSTKREFLKGSNRF